MNDYNPSDFSPTAPINQKKAQEAKKIKKLSNLIGATFIVVWLVPDILNALLSDIIKILGPNQNVAAFFSDPAVVMGLQIVFSICMFTLPFLILPIGLGKNKGELALIKKPEKGLFIPFVFMGVGISAFANIVTNKLSEMFASFDVYFLSPEMELPEGLLGFFISFIAIAVTPALVEEFATRGMVMGVAREYGEGFGLVVSATFFALMHGNLVQIPFAFIMGLIIGFAVIKSGSLITGIVIHFFNNAISVSMNYILDSINSVKTESIISLVYIVVCTIIFLLGAVLAQRNNREVWRLKPAETEHTAGEKLKLFFLSPCVIAAIGVTAADCAAMIQIG